MKLIHCADLHLDSPLRTHMSAEKAAARSAEILQTFRRLTRYAQDNGVRAVLIAGDLFDGARVRQRTVETVLDAVSQTPEVDYLYLPGNHDAAAHAFFGRALPANLRCFGGEWQTFDYGEVAVSGIRMTARNADTLYDSLPCRPGAVHLVLLHGQIGTVSGADRIDLRRLEGRGVAYLALGHLHSFAQGRLAPDGLYCYAGCLEGRGFDECGEKGFVLLETAHGQVRPQFVPFAGRTLHRVQVDLTGLRSHVEVLRKLDALDLPAGDMVELVLTGASAPEAGISAASVENAMRGRYFFCRVRDESRLAAAPKDYQNDVSLKGALIRLILAGDEPEADKAAMIRAGLAALTGEEIQL